MRMLLKSKDIAYVSVMTAMAVLLLIVSCYIESSTLFFLAAASFLTGVVEQKLGIIPAVFQLICTAALGVLLTPQKLYCGTYMCLGIYVALSEYIEIQRKKNDKAPIVKLAWFVKGLVFEIMLVLTLIVYDYFIGLSTMITKEVLSFTGSGIMLWIILIVIAQILWLVFDRAFIYFMKKYWRLLRTKES